MSAFAPLPITDAGSAFSPRFTHQQTCVLHALASGCTPTEAAEHADTHRSQTYVWMNMPSFRLSLENAQREHYTAIAARFHSLATKAQNALEQILDDPKCSPHARLKAARMIFAQLERGQPALPRTTAEANAIDQQCKDKNAPHIVIGRPLQSVTDPDAEPQKSIEAVTDPDAEPRKSIEAVTDPDAKTEHATAAPRQIMTKNTRPPRPDILDTWIPVMQNVLKHIERKFALRIESKHN